MKLIVNQAYENMGLASTQMLGPILDGLMRNTPDADALHRAGRARGRAAPRWRGATAPFGDYSQAPAGEQPNPDNVIRPVDARALHAHIPRAGSPPGRA